MDIKLEIEYNNANSESTEFVNGFKHDLQYCLSRFKHNAEWIADGNKANYRFIALSNSDFEDSRFIDSLELKKRENTCILVIVNKITTNNPIFEPHKFSSFQFWDEVAETNEIRPFNNKNADVKAFYWERITDIAVEISERNIADDFIPENTIYLAQTDNSQMSEWLNIKRDLNDIGSRVLPSKLLSTDIEECTTQITENIERCGILIHLIPTAYKKYFVNSDISVTEHQLNISTEIMARSKFKMKRIIWIPSDYEFTDEENQIFIEKIQRDQTQSQNSSILKVSLEDLKRIYRRMLAGLDAENNADKLPDVYLISDQNKEQTTKIDGIESNLKVETNFTGISYNQHLRYLANAQIVVLNYTNENEQWINVKVNDILKSPGLETSKPNKKLILIKNDKELNTKQFETVFDEVQVMNSGAIKLDTK